MSGIGGKNWKTGLSPNEQPGPGNSLSSWAPDPPPLPRDTEEDWRKGVRREILPHPSLVMRYLLARFGEITSTPLGRTRKNKEILGITY